MAVDVTNRLEVVTIDGHLGRVAKRLGAIG
jgi:hypothetical protein